MGLTNIALKRPVSITILVFGMAVFCILSVLGMNLQYMPDMDLPMLIVSTVYPGAGPSDVETLISRKIEGVANLLNAVNTIQSRSNDNSSLIIIQYEFGTDINKAYFDLREGLDAVKSSLPDGAMEPTIIEMNINQQDSISFSLSADEGVDLLHYVNNELVPELERRSEIATVEVTGGRQAYISVELDASKMARYGISMQTIASVVKAANFSLPIGTTQFGGQTVSLGASVEYSTLESLKSIPLPTQMGVITLSDVAEVRDSFKNQASLSRYNGSDNISVGIKKRQSSTDIAVCRAAKAVIASMDTEADGVYAKVDADQSVQIMSSLNSILQTLLLAVLLSMAILFLFTGDWKASLIVGTSIPISLIFTLVLMSLMGYSLNMLTMSALVIGVGMMVDNSIVVLESCFVTYTDALGFEETARIGTRDVMLSIMASTITTIVVFLPLALVGGFVSVMFGQVAFTIVFALTGSLLSAVTLVPLCYSRYKPMEKKGLRFNMALTRFEDMYGRMLKKIIYRKKTVVFVSFALLIASLAIFANMNLEMFPMVDGGQLELNIDTRPGLSLASRSEIYKKLESLASQEPDTASYRLTASSASSSASLSINLKAKRSRTTAEAVNYYQEQSEKISDCSVTARMVSSLFSATFASGTTTGVDITIQSDDRDLLDKAAGDIGDYMRGISGIQRVSSSAFNRTSRVSVEIDPILSSAKGILPAQAAGSLYSALGGINTIDVKRNGITQTVTVEYPKDAIGSLSMISSIQVPSQQGAAVPLSDIASVKFTDAEQSIERANGKYQITISGQTMSYDAVRISSQVTAALKKKGLPEGVSFAQTLQESMRSTEFNRLYYAILEAVLLVFMVMAIEFESVRYSLMVMVSIPFSLIGSTLLLFVTTGKTNMAAMMGVLLLVGTVVNNGILYVDTVNLYRNEMTLEEALIESGKRRMRPILMTSLTTILSMIPVGTGIGSSKQMQGMALVIIGGLTASTVLTLLLMPTFYLLIAKKPKAGESPALEA